jgi:hypothetical protein
MARAAKKSKHARAKTRRKTLERSFQETARTQASRPGPTLKADAAGAIYHE